MYEEMVMAEEEVTVPCQICGERRKRDEVVPAARVHALIVEVIRREHPAWSPEGYICYADLNRFRTEYARDAVEKEKEEYAQLEGASLPGIREEDHLPKNINVEYEKELTFGERLSDRIAVFAGSWSFIAAFTGLIFLWVALNTYIFFLHPFDPYPYILLNLVLSILTAIQAPIIIMSQNRQEIRDRLHAERDYRVSVHSELEIHRLHKKIDYLLSIQGQRLLEIQNIQMELMEELAGKTAGVP
jgi:uncharacterized membrane protein